MMEQGKHITEQRTDAKSNYSAPWVKAWQVKPAVAVMSPGPTSGEAGEDGENTDDF